MMDAILSSKAAASIALLLAIVLLNGCGAGMNRGAEVPRATSHAQAAASNRIDDKFADPAAPASDFMHRSYGVTDQEDAARLERLWVTRTTGNIDTNYPIGPGDVLEIDAQYVDELKAKTVRVAGDGSIDLPLLGTLRAAGLSEEALSIEIARKLRKYIYKPEVEVFVRTYHSHQVAVIGAVKNAELITLSDSKETIMDMLKQAGGTSADAGDAVILFPGADSDNDGLSGSPELLKAADVVNTAAEHITLGGNPDPQHTGRQAAAVPHDLQPVIIPLRTTSLTPNSMLLPSAENFLRMPVRPGDLLLVPGGGEVMVMGWVRAPGHFRITPGLTALEAIAAAGGPLYAGNQSDVQLIRTDPSGTKRIIPINVAAIKRGHAEDPAVFPNDVINVPVSSMKLVPYELFTLLNRTGLGVAAGGMSMGVGGFGGVP